MQRILGIPVGPAKEDAGNAAKLIASDRQAAAAQVIIVDHGDRRRHVEKRFFGPRRRHDDVVRIGLLIVRHLRQCAARQHRQGNTNPHRNSSSRQRAFPQIEICYDM
ncbi:hypothetical protein MOP88_11445 [Sphingomonas sp. WKB10]|nr:hypothetical protein [Sphingomonas sp. WKB10]